MWKNAKKFGFYGHNGQEKGTSENPHQLRVITNDEEYGPIEERFNNDSWFREMKLGETPPFTAHCARIMDIIASTKKEELTAESGITGDGVITKRITHTAMAARQPEEMNLNSPASETTTNRKKRKEWREKQTFKSNKMQKTAHLGNAAIDIVMEIRQNTEKVYKPKPIEPDSHTWAKRETITAALSNNKDQQGQSGMPLPCLKVSKDDRSDEKRGRQFTQERSRSPAREEDDSGATGSNTAWRNAGHKVDED